MRFASYGHWSRFVPGTADPESYVEQALDGEAAGCDLLTTPGLGERLRAPVTHWNSWATTTMATTPKRPSAAA